MKTSRRVAINGDYLDEVDDSIVIQSIQPKAGKDTFSVITPYGNPGGQRVTGTHRDTIDIQIGFAIRMKKGRAAERSRILEAASAWAAQAAQGAWITISQKEGRRLWARIVQYPEEGDMRAWTTVYSMTFRAYEVPWWQDVDPVTVRRANVSSLSQRLDVTGSVNTVLDVAFTNTSGATCNTITINTGSAMIKFSGLGMANGQTFRISHGNNGRISATIGGSSCLAKRTTGSSDDLWIAPGVPVIQFSADQAGSLEMSCTGRYA